MDEDMSNNEPASETPAILEGTELPDIAVLSPRVAVALGQNPSMFTGPGTNTVLVGTGPKRFLLDTGSGHDEYMPVLEEAIARAGCREIEGIVLTHAHPDHIGGFDYLLRVNPKVKIYFPHDLFGAGAPLAKFPIGGKEPDVVNELPVEQRYFGGKTMDAALVTDGRYYKAVE